MKNLSEKEHLHTHTRPSIERSTLLCFLIANKRDTSNFVLLCHIFDLANSVDIIIMTNINVLESDIGNWYTLFVGATRHSIAKKLIIFAVISCNFVLWLYVQL